MIEKVFNSPERDFEMMEREQIITNNPQLK